MSQPKGERVIRLRRIQKANAVPGRLYPLGGEHPCQCGCDLLSPAGMLDCKDMGIEVGNPLLAFERDS